MPDQACEGSDLPLVDLTEPQNPKRRIPSTQGIDLGRHLAMWLSYWLPEHWGSQRLDWFQRDASELTAFELSKKSMSSFVRAATVVSMSATFDVFIIALNVASIAIASTSCQSQYRQSGSDIGTKSFRRGELRLVHSSEIACKI